MLKGVGKTRCERRGESPLLLASLTSSMVVAKLRESWAAALGYRRLFGRLAEKELSKEVVLWTVWEESISTALLSV